jgi:hypothetical protein
MHHTTKQTAHILLNINMPNGTSIQLSHASYLLLIDLPYQVRKVHILPGLVHNSLISVRQLCYSGYDITFIREKLEVMKDGHCVMSDLRDPQSRIWRVNLKEVAKPVCKAEFKHAHENSNQKA